MLEQPTNPNCPAAHHATKWAKQRYHCLCRIPYPRRPPAPPTGRRHGWAKAPEDVARNIEQIDRMTRLDGKSTAQIARETGYSTRTVTRYRARARQERQQSTHVR
jgi:Sigma-70, region 4